ncbi:phage tail spike protein [Cytobacillus firmus]
MPELLIFDPADNLLAILSNEAEDACLFKSAPFKEVINQGSFFEFVAQGDHEDSQYLIAENQVAFLDKDGYFRLFVIKEPDQTNGLDGPQIRCVCEPAMNELNEEWIEDVRPYNTTLADAQNRALAGTRWKPGISADLGINSINYFYISVNEAIQENINTWGGELRDRIEIKDNKIIGRYIDILPRRGQDSGKIWEIDKDIISLSHKVQSYPKTALYGRGASLETDNGGFTRKITFADAEWKVANGDPVDKPKGQEWVGDPGALAAFGRINEDGTKRHRKGSYENGQQEDPAALLQETWEALQQQKHQFHNYEMDVFLLEQISGYEHEKVRLGDTTFAIDRSFAQPIEVEQRVISFEYDVADPDNTGTVELGQYIDLYSDDDRLDKMEAQLNDGISIWNGAAGPVTDDDIENITPPKTLNVIASGGYFEILVQWDFVSSIYIANYEVYASQIQGFTPDLSNLAFRGKSSTYGHKADSNQQWYFRVRAINTHGVPGEFSDEAMAQTARNINDEILFGPEIAEKLRELSETAAILADGSVDLNQIKQDALDAIQADARQYTNAEILAAEQAIQADLNLRIGSVNSDITSLRLAVDEDIATLNSTASDLLQRVSDNEIGLAAAGGKITTIEQNINTIDGSLSTTISQLSNLDGVVSQQQTTITAMAGQISAKAEKTEVYTKVEADGKINTAVSAAKAEIKLTTDGLRTDVTSVTNKVDNLQIGGRNLVRQREHTEDTTYQTITKTVDTMYGQPVYKGVKKSTGTPPTSFKTFTIKKGETYTATIFAKQDVGSTSVNANIIFYDTVGRRTLVSSSVKTFGEWVRLQVTYTNSGDTDLQVGFYFYLARNIGDVTYFACPMLEKGNVATDFTSAPEDVDGAISAVQSFASSIDQKADSIQLSVSSLTETVDSQGTRISSAETNITQLDSSISLKANAADVYTKSQVDTAVNGRVSTTTYNNKMSQLDLSISGISGRVTNTETSINDLTGEVNSAKSQIATLDIKADGIATSVSEVRNDLDALTEDVDNRFLSAETNISQNATQIGLKASQTSVDSLTGRMSQAESSLTVQAGQIASKVEKDGIISAINQTPEVIKITASLIDLVGDVYITNGQTKITDLAVGTAAIANAAVTNAKIGTLAVGTAQIQDSAITNAKIANASIDNAKIISLSADKLNAGAIRGIDIYGAQFRSSDGVTMLDISGGNIRLRQSNGQYVLVNPDGLFGFNSNGSQRFKADATLVTSSAFGTSVQNVYLASYGEARVVNYDDIPGDGQVGSYRYLPLRASNLFADSLDVNQGTNMYLRTYSNGEVRITNVGSTTAYRALRAANYYGDSIDTNTGTALYLRAPSTGEVRATVNGSTTAYIPIRASNYYGDSIDANVGPNIYIRPFSNGEARITNTGSTTAYLPLRASNLFADSLDVNAGTNLYIRPNSAGMVIVSATGTTGTFRPIKAREFITDTSMRENKKDIEVYSDNVLDIFRNASIYTYHRKNDSFDAKLQLGMMLDEMPEVTYSESGDSFAMYALTSFLGKGIKDLISITDIHADDINWLNIENQYLKQKVCTLERRVKALELRVQNLEDYLYAA